MPPPVRLVGLCVAAAVLATATPGGDGEFARLTARASEAREANRLDEAVRLYKRALAVRPGWAEGWWSIGTIEYDRDHYAEAAAALERAVKLQPRVGIAYAMLGLSEAKLGRDTKALEHLAYAQRLGVGDNPKLVHVMLYTEGTLLLARGEYGKAQGALRVLARDGVDSDELLSALGRAAIGLRTPPQPGATAALEVTTHAGRAEYLAVRGDAAGAELEYKSVIAAHPDFHNVYFAYGRFLLESHENDKAVKAFEHEICNTPNHLLARLGIAGIKLATDPASGLAYAEQAVKLAPNLAEAHFLLGSLLLATANTSRAVQELERARALAPGEAKIYLALGDAYTAANRLSDAARVRAVFKRLNEGAADLHFQSAGSQQR